MVSDGADWDENDSPYEDDRMDCDHSDADVDIMEGSLSCRCGYRKWLTGDEIRREAQLQAEMMEAYFQQSSEGEAGH